MTEKETQFEIERLRLENEHLRVQLKQAESTKSWRWIGIALLLTCLLIFSVNLLPDIFVGFK